MADRNNPFGTYDENNAGRTVKNVTSSMWEPISAGPSVQKDTPVRKNGEKPKNTQSGGKNSHSSQKKTAGRKPNGVDVTKDRISQGGKKVKEDKNKNTKEAQKPKKKKSAPADKKPVGSKSREPKGRDTRNLDAREEQARIQKEKKRARERAKSRKKAQKKSRQGVSYDEMRKKKSAATRFKAKFIAFVTVVLVLVVVLCCAGIYVYRYGATVASITVSGENRYKNEKIIEAANVYVGINMLSVREKAVNEAVTKALPYIKDVRVDYQFPETLALSVSSTEEKFLIAGSTGYICLDGDGKVLSLKKKKLTDGRYLVEGFEEQTAVAGEIFVPTENNEEKYEKTREIVSALESTGKFPKGTINVANLKDVTVVYDSRINIYLGDCARLENQIESAVNVIEKDEDIINGQSGYIETRYEGQTTFKPGSMQK